MSPANGDHRNKNGKHHCTSTEAKRSYSAIHSTFALLTLSSQVSCFTFQPTQTYRYAWGFQNAFRTRPLASSVEEVDIAVIGAGIGGLAAGAILNTLYNQTVAVYESHYLPGGCAHAFPYKSSSGEVFTFDAGPTILLGCSSPPFNPLRQVLDAIGQEVDWIPYDGWGMVELGEDEKRWRVQLGPSHFETGPLTEFVKSQQGIEEFRELKKLTEPLLSGLEIPAMAMRSDDYSLIPLLRYFSSLIGLVQKNDLVLGTFDPYMNGPEYNVTDPWLRSYLDALAFSLSGLPAQRTSAAAMAFVLYDMHRPEASLDYPRGGLGAVIDALVRGLEQGENGSELRLKSHVDCMEFNEDGRRVVGLRLKNGKRVIARKGVICNAPVWTLRSLLGDNDSAKKLMGDYLPLEEPNLTWQTDETTGQSTIQMTRTHDPTTTTLLQQCDKSEMTGSFLHLHVALDATSLNLSELEAHYTVMSRGLTDPCGEQNMIAVSNPCKLDPGLAPEGYVIVHAYAAGNEPYEKWRGMNRRSDAYKRLKEERAEVLWEAVESVIPDAKSRCVLELIGSPLTHERFLRRPRGTYGSATEDYLPNGKTPIQGLVLCGDGVFPGIGIPAVALSGASAANAVVGVWDQWRVLDDLKRRGKI